MSVFSLQVRRCLELQCFPLIVGLVVAIGQSAALSAADIDFRATATVGGSTILLKDVAVVSDADAQLAGRLLNVELAPAPPPGRRIRLDFAAIRSRLEAMGLASGEIHYAGSSVIIVASERSAAAPRPRRVVNAKATLSPSQVHRAEQIATQAVRKSLRMHQRDSDAMFVEVMLDPSQAVKLMSASNETLQVSAIDPTVSEPQAVELKFDGDHGHADVIHAQCILSKRPQLPVVTRNVPAGDVIQEADLAWKPEDSTEGFVTRPEDLIGKEAKKGLRAGDPVHANQVRSVPLVRTNDIVTGVWKSGGIRITGQFKAKGEGALGDVVTLIKLTGREQLLARVTDIHEAEILHAQEVRTNRAASETAAPSVSPVEPPREPGAVNAAARGASSASPRVVPACGATEQSANRFRPSAN